MVAFMNLRNLGVGIGTIGGIFAYYQFDRAKNFGVHASWTTGYIPSQKWDSNWDMRANCKPSSKNLSSDTNDNEPQKVSKSIRNIILIRHGQYNLNGETDEERRLTDLGIKQARMTGSRLRELDLPYSRIISSTMTRARETTKYVSECLPGIPVEECSLLEEGAPIPPEPPVGHWKPPNYQFFQDGVRIEAAFRKFFHRADIGQETDSYDVIVCHANVIRYFVCRALQYPPEGWLRLSLRHASITWLSITPNGKVTLRCYGDAGYMPPHALTTS